MSTGIEWTDETWNPTTGCDKVSPGCDNCYAEVMYERFNGKGSFATVKMHPSRLEKPVHWRKPRKVFVNSMSDLFHKDVTEDFIAKVWTVMAATPRHTYQILTKRHARMRSVVRRIAWRLPTAEERAQGVTGPQAYVQADESLNDHLGAPRILPNVWLGVSVENQQWADIRIPALLETPAAVRWLSCEPLLGPLDLKLLDYYEPDHDNCSGIISPSHEPTCGIEPGEFWGINWVVVGGESGRGARPMQTDWTRSLREQCNYARVPFLFKQWGEFGDVNGLPVRLGKKAAGRELDGRTWDEYPQEAGHD